MVLMKLSRHEACSLVADSGVMLLLIFGERLSFPCRRKLRKFACGVGETLELLTLDRILFLFLPFFFS